jgi:hypothetical protein
VQSLAFQLPGLGLHNSHDPVRQHLQLPTHTLPVPELMFGRKFLELIIGQNGQTLIPVAHKSQL